MESELASATSTAAILQAEKSKLQQEVQESKKEQDDLLMLLADQDQKILTLKQKLKDLGETVRASGQSCVRGPSLPVKAAFPKTMAANNAKLHCHHLGCTNPTFFSSNRWVLPI